MLLAILNKSWLQNATKQLLFDHLPPILKQSKLDEQDMLYTAGDARINDILLWTLHMDLTVLTDQLELLYISYVWTYDVI